MAIHVVFPVLSYVAAVLFTWGAYCHDAGCVVTRRHDGNLRVICRGQQMTSLPTQWPPGRIVHLSARGTGLYNISSLAQPQVSNCLEKLNLADNQLHQIPPSAFSGLSKLSSLNLDRNFLPQIPGEAFRGLATLRTLSLRFNLIETILDSTFQGLGNLRSLYLDFNSIRVVTARAFDGLSNLTFLSMTHNSLVYGSLPPGLFAATSELQSLHLEHNDNDVDGQYPRHVFQDLAKLRVLSLDTFSSLYFGMDFRAMTGIYDLDLGHKCRLTRLGNDSFEGFRNSSLEIIRLDWCPLHSVDTCTFCHLPRLRWISVSPSRLLPAKMAAGTLHTLHHGIVHNVNLENSLASTNLSSLSTGVYFVNVFCRNSAGRSSIANLPKPVVIDGTVPAPSNVSHHEEPFLRYFTPQCQTYSVLWRFNRSFPLVVLEREIEDALHKPGRSMMHKFEHLADLQLPPSSLHVQLNLAWTELTLSQHFSEVLPPSGVWFSSASSLSRLDLSGLDSPVCHSTFYGLENLVSIDMSGNQCYDISETMWDHLPSLQYLNFSRMTLNNRLFDRLSPRLFLRLPQLKHLDLSYNALYSFSLTALRNSRNIESLRLSYNRISTDYLEGLDPDSTPRLSVLDLSSNNISYLTDPHMYQLERMAYHRNLSLLLDDNPFLCSCGTSIRRFVSWMHNLPATISLTLNTSKPKPPYLTYKCTTEWGESMPISQFYYEFDPICENEQDRAKALTGLRSVLHTCIYGPWRKTALEVLGVICVALCFALWRSLDKILVYLMFPRSEFRRAFMQEPASRPYTRSKNSKKCSHAKENSGQTVAKHQRVLVSASSTQRSQVQQKATALSCQPIVCSKWQTSTTVGVEGGVLRMTGSDVILHVPSHAVPGDGDVDIRSAVCANTEHVHSVLNLSKEEEVVSPLAEFWAGVNFVFGRFVCLEIPHCLPPHPDLDLVRVYRISRDRDDRVETTQLRRREHLQRNVIGALEEGAFFFIRADGKVLVYTDRFSAYVCVYCGLRQGPVSLQAMVCGTHQRKPSGQHAVHISVHVWDRRLGVRDFREEYGVDARGKELASMAVNLLENDAGGSSLCLRVETSGQEARHWQPCTRSDGSPTTPLVQRHPLSTIVTCESEDCGQGRVWVRPVTSHWALESRQGSRPGDWLQCVLDLSHVACDVTSEWRDRPERERVTTLPFPCNLETGAERAIPLDDVDRRVLYELLLGLSTGQLQEVTRTMGLPALPFHWQSQEEHKASLVGQCLQVGSDRQLLFATLSALSSHNLDPSFSSASPPILSVSGCPDSGWHTQGACGPLSKAPSERTAFQDSAMLERHVLACAQRAHSAVRPTCGQQNSTRFQAPACAQLHEALESVQQYSSHFSPRTQLHESLRAENLQNNSPHVSPRMQQLDSLRAENLQNNSSHISPRMQKHETFIAENLLKNSSHFSPRAQLLASSRAENVQQNALLFPPTIQLRESLRTKEVQQNSSPRTQLQDLPRKESVQWPLCRVTPNAQDCSRTENGQQSSIHVPPMSQMQASPAVGSSVQHHAARIHPLGAENSQQSLGHEAHFHESPRTQNVKHYLLQSSAGSQSQDSLGTGNVHQVSSHVFPRTEMYDAAENAQQPLTQATQFQPIQNLQHPCAHVSPRTQFQDSLRTASVHGPSHSGDGYILHDPGSVNRADSRSPRSFCDNVDLVFPTLSSVRSGAAAFAELSPSFTHDFESRQQQESVQSSTHRKHYQPAPSHLGSRVSGQNSTDEIHYLPATVHHSSREPEHSSAHRIHYLSATSHLSSRVSTHRKHCLPATCNLATQQSDNTSFHVQPVPSPLLLGAAYHQPQQTPIQQFTEENLRSARLQRNACAVQQGLSMPGTRGTHGVYESADQSAETLGGFHRGSHAHVATSPFSQERVVFSDSDDDQLLDVENESDRSV